MSRKDSTIQPAEEPKAFFIWNHHLTPTTTVIGGSTLEDLAKFNIVYGTQSTDRSSLLVGEVIPVSQVSEFDEPEEMEGSLANPKGPAYNIIQNKLNLCEKRGPKFICRECRYVVHTRLSMVTHMKMHLKPFCEVCFSLFDSKDAVRRHIESAHPEVVLRDRSPPPPSSDFYCFQTVAPPNTPTPISDDEMATFEELINPIVKFPVNVAAVHKLLHNEDTDGVSTEDEQRLVIDDGSTPGPSRGRPVRPKKTPTLKRTLKKKPNKVKIKDVTATPDSVMKKITSRFGRSISLKMPQY
ncbi:uncharacterized protein LOC135705860 [Ochlerotatus camptorhynchus]|uniref:uncharacterized protein LOC135705860 n=1 Tax=Ochlerotatus camptorhynchus TaxID=644619 RepID=UPI0031DD954B